MLQTAPSLRGISHKLPEVPHPRPALAPCAHKARRRTLEEDEDCSICMAPLIPDGEEAAKHHVVWCKASCGRSFHCECWLRWRRTFRRNNDANDPDRTLDITCPLCTSPWSVQDHCLCDGWLGGRLHCEACFLSWVWVLLALLQIMIEMSSIALLCIWSGTSVLGTFLDADLVPYKSFVHEAALILLHFMAMHLILRCLKSCNAEGVTHL